MTGQPQRDAEEHELRERERDEAERDAERYTTLRTEIQELVDWINHELVHYGGPPPAKREVYRDVVTRLDRALRIASGGSESVVAWCAAHGHPAGPHRCDGGS